MEPGDRLATLGREVLGAQPSPERASMAAIEARLAAALRRGRSEGTCLRQGGKLLIILVTMGCGDECPVVPGVERDDWPLEDPKGKPIERACVRSETKWSVGFVSCWLSGGGSGDERASRHSLSVAKPATSVGSGALLSARSSLGVEQFAPS